MKNAQSIIRKNFATKQYFMSMALLYTDGKKISTSGPEWLRYE